MNRKQKLIALGIGSAVVLLSILASGVAFIWWLSSYPEEALEEARQNPPESLSQYPIFSPRFETTLGTIFAGTAFLGIDTETDKVYMLTAHHLLGESGGLPREVSWDEVNDVLISVQFVPDVEGFELITLHKALLIEGAKSLENTSGADDILAFRVGEEYKPWAIPFRRGAPLEIWQPVWLYSQVVDREGLQHLGLINEATDDWLEYIFDEKIPLRATSGAPVVDKHGHLVGINLGGYTEDVVYGLANPLVSIKNHLRQAEGSQKE